MRLFLFRHAEAEDVSPTGSDFDRRLTDVGIARTHAAGKVLRRLDVKPTQLLTSPLVRARQTAAILAEALNTESIVREALGNDFSLAALEMLMHDVPHDGSLMCVGHEPSLSYITGQITAAHIAMKRGGMVRIDLAPGRPLHGEIVWLIAPKVFDALA
jgi:phosphohistidine phosphatase